MNDIKYIEGTKHISIIGEKFNLLTVIGVNRIEKLKKSSDNKIELGFIMIVNVIVEISM